MSTPMGPVEVGQAWYAHNRLGLNTLVCQAWGVDLDRITNHVTICRVICRERERERERGREIERERERDRDRERERERKE